MTHQGCIDLVVTEGVDPSRSLEFWNPHGKPHIRVHGIGFGNRFEGVVCDQHGASRSRCHTLCRLHDAGIGLVPGRARNGDVDAQQGATLDQAVRNVVAIADEGDSPPPELSPELAHGEQITDDLTRVVHVGESVDDGDGCGRSETAHVLITERSNNESLGVAADDLRGILDRLAAIQLQFVGPHRQWRSTQLCNRRLERDTRPGGRLVEVQHHRVTAEENGGFVWVALEAPGDVEQREEVGTAQSRDAQEVPDRLRRICRGKPATSVAIEMGQLGRHRAAVARAPALCCHRLGRNADRL